MKKYTHSKESTKELRTEQKRALDLKKIENHKTVERQLGHFYPEFGSSLGVSYDGINGIVTKVGRATAVA